MSDILFSDFSLKSPISEGLNKMGFVTPTPIQQQTIPVLLKGGDIIGQAETGTGKTAAFGIPLLQFVDPSNRSTQGLVMCPTRELAIQVASELEKLSHFVKGINILAVYGGAPIQNQIRILKKGVHIIVGTPGRLIDHINRGTCKIDQTKFVVLDEADEMLSMGFREDIEMILSQTNEDRQTVLFSATMPKAIKELASKFQSSPQHINVTSQDITSDKIEQLAVNVRGLNKLSVVMDLVKAYPARLSLVFCNTKARVDEVAKLLSAEGLQAEGIHGDLNQNQRNRALEKFKQSGTGVLVATDVAARGIDISDIDLVINYDIPMDPEYYVHRIGRTGRANRTGVAISLIGGSHDKSRVKQIEHYAKTKLSMVNPPTSKDIFRLQKDKLLADLKSRMEEGMDNVYYDIIDEFFVKGVSNRQLAAGLLALMMPKSQMSTASLPPEPRAKSGVKKGKSNRSKSVFNKKYKGSGKKTGHRKGNKRRYSNT